MFDEDVLLMHAHVHVVNKYQLEDHFIFLGRGFVARHCARLRRNDCPSHHAMAQAMAPDRKKRTDRISRGGASATMIRADVKADDQAKAKIRPRRIARKSMTCA